MSRRLVSLVVVATFALTASGPVACGGETEAEPTASSGTCIEGRVATCTCDGGRTGRKTCNSTNQWSVCDCGSPTNPAPDGGADVDTTDRDDVGDTRTDAGRPDTGRDATTTDAETDTGPSRDAGRDCADFDPDAEPCTSGKVMAIAPEEHPNLYFDQAEIEAMRESIVEKRQPEKAADAYFNHVQGTSPAHKPDDFQSLDWPDNFYEGMRAAKANMQASFSYMLEPTTAKAEALRDALYSWTGDQGPYWTYAGQQSGWIHISLAFMYDLLYNSGVLDQEDKAHFDDWFSYVADNAIRSNSWWTDQRVGDDNPVVEQEGTAREAYPNWWTIQISCGLVSAMVSHDQSMVDKGYNSDVPPTYYKSDLSDYDGTRDLQNLIVGSVFPSGYNWDGYKRNYGFDAPDETFEEAGEPDRGQGQRYHFYSIFPMIFAAEAATHNGDNAFAYGEHAILRTFKRGSAWAHTTFRKDTNYDQRHLYRLVYRHYPNDPEIREATEAVPADHYTQRLIDKSSAIWAALGDIEVERAP